jgi:ubiquinone/menaquinone biosynthesis C-methylase UbiE
VRGKVIALDIDCEMLERAKAEVVRAGATVQRWICADAVALKSHMTELVDFALIANTFHGVPDKTGLARAVRAVLRPHGLFAVMNWHHVGREQTLVLGEPRGPKTEMRMSPDAVAAVVVPAGFQSVEIVELPPYHYGSIFMATGP